MYALIQNCAFFWYN